MNNKLKYEFSQKCTSHLFYFIVCVLKTLSLAIKDKLIINAVNALHFMYSKNV